MDIQTLNQKIKELELQLENHKKKLIIEYCDLNNTYKIGDIFKDHIGSIVIEKIGYSYSINKPCCTYFGLELKKDGTPRKDRSWRTAWQSNDINKK